MTRAKLIDAIELQETILDDYKRKKQSRGIERTKAKLASLRADLAALEPEKEGAR